jgi:hypothetical protein
VPPEVSSPHLYRERACGIAITRRRTVNFMMALCLAALSWEWLLNLALAQFGLIERFESQWELIHRRGLFCIVVAAAMVVFTADWTRMAGHRDVDTTPSPDR